MMAALLVSALMMQCSCVSRNKAKKSKVYIEQVEGHQMKSLVLIDQAKRIEKLNTLKTGKLEINLSDFTGDIADPTKPAYREIDTTGGKIRETFNNFKNVNSKNQHTATETKDTTAAYCETNNNTNLKIDTSDKSKSNKKLKTKAGETETSRASIWLYVLGFLIIVIIALRLYFKSWNPKNWIK